MFEAQIQKGVEYLDQDLGKSWPERISLEDLDLRDCYCCVIGQLYGDFSEEFKSDLQEAMSNGFDLFTNEKGLMQYNHYAVLTTEWREKISQLRAERAKD